MSDVVNCGECMYWRKSSLMEKYGECRKMTPFLNMNGYGTWPLTKEYEFCYEGVLKDPKTLLTEDK